MTTVIQHQNQGHHRTLLIAAGAAAVAVVTAGVLFGVAQDNGSTTNDTPTGTQQVHKFKLSGNDHQTGSWDHAGTTSGGQTQMGM